MLTSEVPLEPTSQNIFGCKSVFRNKHHPNGSVESKKAHFIAKGFQQQLGLDYQKTFSPVVKPFADRLVVSLVVQVGWRLRQLDVQNALLHGDLAEDVFIQPHCETFYSSSSCFSYCSGRFASLLA